MFMTINKLGVAYTVRLYELLGERKMNIIIVFYARKRVLILLCVFVSERMVKTSGRVHATGRLPIPNGLEARTRCRHRLRPRSDVIGQRPSWNYAEPATRARSFFNNIFVRTTSTAGSPTQLRA